MVGECQRVGSREQAVLRGFGCEQIERRLRFIAEIGTLSQSRQPIKHKGGHRIARRRRRVLVRLTRHSQDSLAVAKVSGCIKEPAVLLIPEAAHCYLHQFNRAVEIWPAARNLERVKQSRDHEDLIIK